VPAFALLLTPQAQSDFATLEKDSGLATLKKDSGLATLEKDSGLAKRLKVVRKTLGLLELHGPRYPGLQSHKYDSLEGAHGEDVWESYVEQRTPAAYRIVWHYGPGQREITILSITAHP